MDLIEKFKIVPITFDYKEPSDEIIGDLKSNSAICEIEEDDSIKLENSYFKQGIEGSFKRVFIRKAVYDRLKNISGKLSTIGSGLIIFDGFRSNLAQLSLFNQFKDQFRENDPSLSEEELMAKTRTFVAHPEEKSRYEVSPHNSGGAIDLAIFDKKTGSIWDFGCGFDDPTEKSQTTCFESDIVKSVGIAQERWEKARGNRRILFGLFKNHGFVNYGPEWWHFDLGDCIWAQTFGRDHIFGSMEQDVEKMARE